MWTLHLIQRPHVSSSGGNQKHFTVGNLTLSSNDGHHYDFNGAVVHQLMLRRLERPAKADDLGAPGGTVRLFVCLIVRYIRCRRHEVYSKTGTERPRSHRFQ